MSRTRGLADLVALRHSSRALRDGELTLLGARGPALAYLRRDGAEAFAVVLNAADEPLSWDLALPMGIVAAELVPLGGPAATAGRLVVDEGSLRVSLPGRDGAVVRMRME